MWGIYGLSGKDYSNLGLNHPYTLSSAAIFGALAAILAVLPLSFPFPILPYLKFDLAELPVTIAFLLYGPIPGVISSLIYWIVLNFVGSFAPIGPAMKFASVISMVVGMWVGLVVLRRITSRRTLMLVSAIAFGMILRVIVMSIFNYVVLLILFPFFLDFAAKSLSSSLGYSFSSQMEALIVSLIVTAIFNIIHVVVSVIPSFAIASSLSMRGVVARIGAPWITLCIKGSKTLSKHT